MIYISEFAPETVKNAFCGAVFVKNNPALSGGIASHPDMHMCLFRDGTAIFSRPGEVSGEYPESIRFNAVCLDRYFIHNLKYTNPRVLKAAEERGIQLVNVRQGYTKCSCVVPDGKSIITADRGIARVLSGLGDVEVLTVSPGHVVLSGYDYGFLGGASGLVDGVLWFAGDLSRHPDFDKIMDFLDRRKIAVRWFPDIPLTDVGSIIQTRREIR